MSSGIPRADTGLFAPRARRTILGGLFVSSLTLAVLELGAGILHGTFPLRHRLPAQLLAATALLVSVAYLLGLAIVWVLLRTGRLRASPAALAWAFLLSALVAYPALVLPSVPESECCDGTGALVYATLAALACAFLYRGLVVLEKSRWWANLAAVVLAAPFVAALGLALVLGLRFLSKPGAHMFAAALFLAALLALLRLVVRLGSRRVLAALGAAYLGTLVSPFAVTSLDMLRGRTSEPALSSPADSSPPVRHVILVTVDTLRPDHLSCYGSPLTATPQLDRLCSDGVIFRNAFSAGPWTLPALVSLMTGTPATVHGAVRPTSRAPALLPTLGQRLRARGYRTHAIVGNAHLNAQHALFQGFEGREMLLEPPPRPSPGQRLLSTLGASRPSTEAITRRAVAFVRAHAQEPFFLWLHLYDPHLPYAPPREYLGEMPPPSVGTRFARLSDVRSGYFVPSLDERAWVRKLYDGEVRYVDTSVGALLAELRGSGLYEDALIVLTSDHGEEFWEHGGFEHGHTLYNEVLRVPLVIKGPGVPRGRSVEAAASTQDVMATILDLCGGCGAVPPGSLSLRPLWEGGPASQRPVLATGMLTYDERLAVVFGDRKYIRNVVTGGEELFDLRSDPEERRTLVFDDPQGLQSARHVLATELEHAQRLRTLLGLPDVAEELVLDPTTREQLRAVGYIR